MGMILATTIFMLDLEARIWSTSLLKAAVISAGERLLQMSLVPSLEEG